MVEKRNTFAHCLMTFAMILGLIFMPCCAGASNDHLARIEKLLASLDAEDQKIQRLEFAYELHIAIRYMLENEGGMNQIRKLNFFQNRIIEIVVKHQSQDNDDFIFWMVLSYARFAQGVSVYGSNPNEIVPTLERILRNVEEKEVRKLNSMVPLYLNESLIPILRNTLKTIDPDNRLPCPDKIKEVYPEACAEN